MEIFWLVLLLFILLGMLYFILRPFFIDKIMSKEANKLVEELNNVQINVNEWDVEKYIAKFSPCRYQCQGGNNLQFCTFDSDKLESQYSTIKYDDIISVSASKEQNAYSLDIKIICKYNTEKKITFSHDYTDNAREAFSILKTIEKMNEIKSKGGIWRIGLSDEEQTQLKNGLQYTKENYSVIQKIAKDYKTQIFQLIDSSLQELWFFSDKLFYVLLCDDKLSQWIVELDGFDTSNKKRLKTTHPDEDKTLIFLRGLKKRIRKEWNNDFTLDSAVYCVIRIGVIEYFNNLYGEQFSFATLEDYCKSILGQSLSLNYNCMLYTCFCLYRDSSLPLYGTFEKCLANIKDEIEHIKSIKELEKENVLEEVLFEDDGSDITESTKIPVVERIPTIQQTDIMSGEDFEHFIAKYFEKIGYNVTITPYSGDYGIDIIAANDFVKIGIQTKCYGGKVTNSAVQEVVAGMKHYNLDKGMVITNSYFTNSAKELAKDNQVILWDRKTLSQKLEEIKR